MGLNYHIAPIKGLLSVPNVINNKVKSILENKEKIYGTMKTVDNSIKRIKTILEQKYLLLIMQQKILSK